MLWCDYYRTDIQPIHTERRRIGVDVGTEGNARDPFHEHRQADGYHGQRDVMLVRDTAECDALYDRTDHAAQHHGRDEGQRI